jgi:CubicO group peptidase (beta-lactamase class C family)
MNLDDFLVAQLREHRIAGLSLAVISGGDVAKVRCYGFVDQSEKISIASSTLFQAASISKCLTAVAALRLVDQGLLVLDEDINPKLQSWKIPRNDFVNSSPVTLRRLLCHNAGFTVHGFRGYAVGEPVPMLTQILDGVPPANNAAICVDSVPGANPRYSGGGYTVLQQVLIDIVGRPFPELMQSLVLQPLGMTASTFDQPLPEALRLGAATGHTQNGQPIAGGARIYPEMAAAGLWSTPSDLARFVIGIQQSPAGRAGSILSPAGVREMLTPQAAKYGLGPTILGQGQTLQFIHSGRNAGFDAVLMGGAANGKGVVVMVNANADPKVLNSILKAVTQESA